MRHEDRYRERCAARGLDEEAIDSSLVGIRELEAEAEAIGFELEGIPITLLDGHTARLARGGLADEGRLVALARYFLAAKIDALAIRLLAYLSPHGLFCPRWPIDWLGSYGEEARRRVMEGLRIPPKGSAPEDYPPAAAAFVSALERELGPEAASRLLAWNVHGLPAAAFAEERESFLASSSIEEWLGAFHQRQVDILNEHARGGSLWFEQRITPRRRGLREGKTPRYWAG